MALKYQLAQLLPSSLRLPWFKVALALLLVFVLFKRDLQFQVNLHAPGVSAVDDQNARSQRTNLLATGSEAIPKTSRNNAPEKRSNPFVASPNDSEKDKKVKAYIRRFAKVAQAESKKYGIPASVKMAQAIVESSAGSSKLATRNNNHFGIKCFSKSCGQGHCSNFSDDHHKDFSASTILPGKAGEPTPICFLPRNIKFFKNTVTTTKPGRKGSKKSAMPRTPTTRLNL
jgi:hypothetical protein